MLFLRGVSLSPASAVLFRLLPATSVVRLRVHDTGEKINRRNDPLSQNMAAAMNPGAVVLVKEDFRSISYGAVIKNTNGKAVPGARVSDH